MNHIPRAPERRTPRHLGCGFGKVCRDSRVRNPDSRGSAGCRWWWCQTTRDRQLARGRLEAIGVVLHSGLRPLACAGCRRVARDSGGLWGEMIQCRAIPDTLCEGFGAAFQATGPTGVVAGTLRRTVGADAPCPPLLVARAGVVQAVLAGLLILAVALVAAGVTARVPLGWGHLAAVDTGAGGFEAGSTRPHLLSGVAALVRAHAAPSGPRVSCPVTCRC
jgi:hypothetical protein